MAPGADTLKAQRGAVRPSLAESRGDRGYLPVERAGPILGLQSIDSVASAARRAIRSGDDPHVVLSLVVDWLAEVGAGQRVCDSLSHRRV